MTPFEIFHHCLPYEVFKNHVVHLGADFRWNVDELSVKFLYLLMAGQIFQTFSIIILSKQALDLYSGS